MKEWFVEVDMFKDYKHNDVFIHAEKQIQSCQKEIKFMLNWLQKNLPLPPGYFYGETLAGVGIFMESEEDIDG